MGLNLCSVRGSTGCFWEIPLCPATERQQAVLQDSEWSSECWLAESGQVGLHRQVEPKQERSLSPQGRIELLTEPHQSRHLWLLVRNY